jgi:UV DNA damage endonuclease
MVDYSSPKPNGLPQQHSETIDLRNFSEFLKQTEPFDFDIMLEIKDKEKSAIQAIEYAMKDSRVQSMLVN